MRGATTVATLLVALAPFAAGAYPHASSDYPTAPVDPVLAQSQERDVVNGANLLAHAAAAFERRYGRLPASAEEIVRRGILPSAPPPGSPGTPWIIDRDERTVAISVDAAPLVCGADRVPSRLSCSPAVRPAARRGRSSYMIVRIPAGIRTGSSF